jgi:transposase
MAQVQQFRRILKGEVLVSAHDAFEIVRSRPHGHVAAVVGTMRRLGLAEMVSTRKHRKRQLVLAMIAARILEPCSKLATAQRLGSDTLSSSLGAVLEVADAEVDDLYEALDWLQQSQGRIEEKLAARHLREGELVLWDASVVPFESHTCPLAEYGRPQKGKGSQLQVLFGLLATAAGIPVAVEVFSGSTADPETVGSALDRLQERFGLKRVVMVGDRGMVTDARIKDELRPRGVGWITALRAPTIKNLWQEGPLQLSLFDERDLAEIYSPDFPGERLIACRNPLLAADRARKRDELLKATESKLQAIVAATRRNKRPLRGRDKIGVRVGSVLANSKVAKHFRYAISEDGFSCQRDEQSIAQEAALDGIYILRTSVPKEELEPAAVVRAYKQLSEVEQAFRVVKDFALEVEPIRHRLEHRVRGHVFLCMLAYYVRRYMEQALAPLLFTEQDPERAQARRHSIVAPARRSEATERKVRLQQTDGGEPVRSLRTLLADLQTLTQNEVRIQGTEVTFQNYTRPTPLQQKAFDLLGVTHRL